jgi:hypothetical protein
MEHLENSPTPPPIRTTSPSLQAFVIYAERSIILGEHDEVRLGDIGIHAIAQTTYGFQLKAGSCTGIDKQYNVYSPSILLGKDVKLGIVQTNNLNDDGISIRSPLPFPGVTMPAPPFAPVLTAGGADVTVQANEVEALLPGSYGNVKVIGILLLNPGLYRFSSVTLIDGSKLLAIAGHVNVQISGDFTAGRQVHVSTAFDRPAGNFIIAVTNENTSETQPAASFGEHCRIRALIVVPHGTLAMTDHTHATGAFVGFDIVLGKHVHVEFQSGFLENKDTEGSHGSQQLRGYYGVNPDPSIAPLVGHVPHQSNITLSIGLPTPDPEGLQTALSKISDPTSPQFRKYLTPAQFHATYGAKAADYQALKDWASANGLSVTATYPNNLLLGVSGTAAQIRTALYVNLVKRQDSEGNPFMAVDREPSIDLAVPILWINGLTSHRAPQRASVSGTGGCPGPNCGTSYRASDLRNAYLGHDPYTAALTGTGQVVGLLQFASYNPADIAGYDALQKESLTLDPTNVISKVIGPAPSPNDEVCLDIEMVQAMAPGAKVFVFQSLNADQMFQAMATSDPQLTSASSSWLFQTDANIQLALNQMQMIGVSFFNASGDYGDVGDPENNLDMDGLTLVGGTFLSTNPLTAGWPNPVYPNPYYSSESTWNQGLPLRSKGVTGGGIMNGSEPSCTCWPSPQCCGNGVPIPEYQRTIMLINAATNGGSEVWRNYPDVAMIADNIEIFYGGNTETVGGTSVASPLWAGLIALVNQWILQLDPAQGLVGFVNPTLYAIGLTRGSPTFDLYQACFNDIDDNGTNFNGFGNGFKSVAGYDLCTGLGTPKSGLFYQLSIPNPLVPNQPLTWIRFKIGTGKDGAGGGKNSSQTTADILGHGGKVLDTVTLRDYHHVWPSWSTKTVDFQLPSTIIPPITTANGIGGVQIHLIQSNPDFSADNWDMASLSVRLFNPSYSDATSVCQLNLVGSNQLQDGSIGLERLSKGRSDSGDGPDSRIFTTGPGSGCP